MGKFFWVMMAILGGVLIVLIVNHDHGSTLGIENEKLASAAFGSMWIALIASAVFQRERRFGDILKQLAIWLGIFVALTAVYVFRFDIQDIACLITCKGNHQGK